jgi:RNA polymerase sigma factor (sigma-70 family)
MSMERQNTSAPKQTTAEETNKAQDEKASKARATESGGEQTGRHSDKRCRKRPTYKFEDFNKPEDILDTAILLMGLRYHDPHAQQDFYNRYHPKIHAIAVQIMQNGRLDILSAEDIEQELLAKLYEVLTCQPIRKVSGMVALVNTTLNNALANLLNRHILRQETVQPCGMCCDLAEEEEEEQYLPEGAAQETVIVNAGAGATSNTLSILDNQDGDMERFTIGYYLDLFLEQADPETACIIRGAFKEDKVCDEIARDLGCTPTTCKHKYDKAKYKLKRFFEKYGWKEEHLYA